MDFIFDSSLVLYLPLSELDGASFMSKDAYGHLCTVTGALWTPRGRKLDGADDYITVAANALFKLKHFTIQLFYNPVSIAAVTETLVEIYSPTDTSGLGFNANQGGEGEIQVWIHGTDESWHSSPGTATLTAGSFCNMAVTYDEQNLVEYGDGALLDSVAETNPILYVANPVITIGTTYGQANDTEGIIREILIYSRALTPQEIQRNYLATKWRYR